MPPQRVLEITTNIGCRLRCSYCPQSTVVRAYHKEPDGGGAPRALLHTMTRESFRAYIDTVPASVHIHFSGFSEPWHAEDCVEMIHIAHERGHTIAVFTTADRMTAEDVSRLAGIPFKRFLVHLPDGGGEMRKKVGAEYVSLLRLLASSAIHNLEYHTIGTPHPRIATELDAMWSTRRIQSRAGNVKCSSTAVGVAFSAAEIAARNARTTLICRKDRIFANVLLPNGDVHLCSMDYGLEHRLGNLGDQTYQEIATGPGFARTLAALNDPDSDVLCRRCEYALPGAYRGRDT
ncbi:SPASM domain-containing protein [Nonomuraea sp. NPDC001699]